MSYTSFDEKANYEQRCHRRNRASSDSKWSYKSSSSSMSEKYYENPPAYSHVFYNATADKPLPPLPLQQRRVRFAVEKPLPPLPEGQRYRASSDSSGESAWWAREKRPADGEYSEKSRS